MVGKLKKEIRFMVIVQKAIACNAWRVMFNGNEITRLPSKRGAEEVARQLRLKYVGLMAIA